jgi:methanethiol S-methyltransferase
MATTRQYAHPRQARRRPPAGGAPALLILGYAVAVYAVFVAVTGYAIGFFADAGVPKGIDQGPRSPWPLAVAIDLLVLSLFAVQHTVMARPWFKRRWTRLVPVPAERATYVLCASLLLALLFWLWRPAGGTVWHLRGLGAGTLAALYAIGWVVALGSTFMINHFDLFGLRQAYLPARGAAYRPPPFTERGLYRWIRHPLMAGFVIIFWAAPVMTAGHLLFAAAATGYILLGITFEERDARRDLGQAYRAYQGRVPALVPALGPRSPRSTQTGQDGQGAKTV